MTQTSVELHLHGWHNGPDEEEDEEDWGIWIYEQERLNIPGHGCCEMFCMALPLNLC